MKTSKAIAICCGLLFLTAAILAAIARHPGSTAMPEVRYDSFEWKPDTDALYLDYNSLKTGGVWKRENLTGFPLSSLLNAASEHGWKYASAIGNTVLLVRSRDDADTIFVSYIKHDPNK